MPTEAVLKFRRIFLANATTLADTYFSHDMVIWQVEMGSIICTTFLVI